LSAELQKVETIENGTIWERCQECWELSRKWLPVEVIGHGNLREAEIGIPLADSQQTDRVAALDVWIRDLMRAL
jgi:hypothetical protein